MITNNTIEKYRDSIIKQLYDKCGNYELCLDIFQDACIKAHESDKLYNGGGLYQISKNRMVDIIRYRKTRSKINFKVDFELSNMYIEDTNNVSQLIDFEDNLKLAVEMLNTVSKKKRFVIKERLKGKSFKQISEENNMKMSTILPYYHRGIEEIKNKIKNNGRN